MRKKVLNRILLIMAVISFAVAMVEGYFYYEQHAQYPMFRFMLMLQNSVEAFAFKADISLEDIVKSFSVSQPAYRVLIDYVYALVVFIAPLCTMTFLYKALETVLKWNIRIHKDKTSKQIIIFGYNDRVRALLSKEKDLDKDHDRKIQIVTSGELPSYDELNLLEKGVTVVSFECLGASEAKLKRFYHDIKMDRAAVILLMEETYSKNFSLYQMLNESPDVPCDVKIYCNCEQESIRRIIEAYYDEVTEEEAAKRKDLELIDVTQIQARKILQEHPLHAYYEGTKVPLAQWNVHMLILGFGKLGQQLLLQAMTQGTIHSSNRILIDVVDSRIDELKSVFENHFSSDYFTMTENEIRVKNGGADGELVIRFRKMDLRFRKFEELLTELTEKDPFTYVAVCVKDQDVSLHCVLEMERFFAATGQENVSIGIQIDMDQRVAHYLSGNQSLHKNVFAMESVNYALSLGDVLASDINEKAKEYAYIYSAMDIRCEVEITDKEAAEKGKLKDKEENWRDLKLFKRDSNRDLSCHSQIKERAIRAFGDREALLIKYFGPEGVLRKIGKRWVFEGTEEELVRQINEDPFLKEMAMLEHRRWCYSMAIRGWRGTDGDKNEALRQNPCMVDWKKLCEVKSDTCKYDLQPLLLMYEQMDRKV